MTDNNDALLLARQTAKEICNTGIRLKDPTKRDKAFVIHPIAPSKGLFRKSIS